MFFRRDIEVLGMLKGLVDMHCHILPGIDDGAADVTASLDMLLKYKELGFNGVIATPHILEGAYPNTPESIAEAYSRIEGALKDNDLEGFVKTSAAEHMIDERLMQMLDNKSLLPLKTNYLLVEMSYAQKPSNLKSVLFDMLQAGYQPVLAHPERYNFYSDMKEYPVLKQRGFEFQLNILSLTEHYGAHVQKKAFKLLKDGMFDYVGTDTHRLDHLKAIERMKIPAKYETAFAQLIENTKAKFGV